MIDDLGDSHEGANTLYVWGHEPYNDHNRSDSNSAPSKEIEINPKDNEWQPCVDDNVGEGTNNDIQKPSEYHEVAALLDLNIERGSGGLLKSAINEHHLLSLKGHGDSTTPESKPFLASPEGGNHQNFMDTKVPGKEASQDLARESLIAISECGPDTVLSSKLSSKSNGTNAVELKKSDRAEDYRSKLISISYTDDYTSTAALVNGDV
ncbi:hypothetical protein NE237_024487 [Protea cynaroides]|uniref:Uncharacterized protein n=1 Tax=Protea cynaroides TaxID=273540 RepID=A0A9Q0JZ88_9MAGN|nr:hypothetical protein NE237_024487 [Protea cynaroides]